MSDPFAWLTFEPHKPRAFHEDLGIVLPVKAVEVQWESPVVPDSLNLMEEIKWDFQQNPHESSTYPSLHPYSYPSLNPWRPEWSRRPSNLYLPPHPSSLLPDAWQGWRMALLRGWIGPVTPPRPARPSFVDKLENPVIGYRCWSIGKDAVTGAPRLTSVGNYLFPDHWAPKAATEAHCRLHPGGVKYLAPLRFGLDAEWHGHPVPDWYCECGLYVLSNLADAPNWLHHTGIPHVFGAVVGWGKVIEHGDEGYRAEYARPIAFLGADAAKNLWRPRNETYWTPDELISAAAEEYGVPVIATRKGLELYASEFGQSTREDAA